MTSTSLSTASHAPIGIFDSGVGGLDVAAELTLSLPYERFIYLGDSARVPYGTRTPNEVKRFTEEAVLKLIELGVKAIVLACNTASAWALDELSARYEIPILGMIEAGVEATAQIQQTLSSQEPRGVLILATPRTIESEAYQKRFLSHPAFQDTSLTALACPIFVPLVEAGWAESEISILSAQKYLEELIEAGQHAQDEIGIVLLGCTHYPLLRNSILEGFKRVLKRPVHVVDGARCVALQLKDRLQKRAELAPDLSYAKKIPSEAHIIYTTGDPTYLQALATRFWHARLGQELPPLRSISMSSETKR